MKTSLKKNFIYNIAYQILVLILPLITAPYLSRVIGGDGIGVYSYTQAFAHYFVLLSLLGVENYGNREIARVRDNDEKRSRTFWEIFSIQFFLTIIMITAFVAYVLIASPEHRNIYLAQLFYVVSSAFNINWYFWGVERFKLTVIRNTFVKVLTTAAVFIFVKSPCDLWLYTLIISIGMLLSNIVVWPFLLKEVSFIPITFNGVKRHIKPDLVLFIPVIAVSLYNVMDKIMLGYISTYAEVGFYTYAEKIVRVPVTVIIALGTVMMPHVMNLIEKGKEKECRDLFEKAMLFVLFLGFAFTFGMANLAPAFSDWFYGSDFARCGLFMMILSPVIIIKSWANLVRTQYIIPRGFDNIYILSVIMGAVSNFVFNALLIPKYQGIGAIVGTIIAEFVVCFIQTWKTRNGIDFVPYLKEAFSFGIIGVLMYFVMQCVRNHLKSDKPFFTLVICFFVGTFVYCTFSYIYLAKIKKDKMLLPEIQKIIRIFRFRKG